MTIFYNQTRTPQIQMTIPALALLGIFVAEGLSKLIKINLPASNNNPSNSFVIDSTIRSLNSFTPAH